MNGFTLPRIGPALLLGLALAAGQAAATGPVGNLKEIPGLTVRRTIVNLARDFELTISLPSWDCHTVVTRAASGVIGNSVAIGVSVAQKTTPCTEADKGELTFFVSGAIQSGNYTVDVMGFETCSPQCSGPLWTASAGPIELDLEKLLKKQATSIFNPPENAGMATAGYRNGRIDLALPGNGAGTWRAEVFAPSGKRIQSADLIGSGNGAPAAMALGAAPQTGIYFMRLRSPEQRIQTLKIAVQD